MDVKTVTAQVILGIQNAISEHNQGDTNAQTGSPVPTGKPVIASALEDSAIRIHLPLQIIKGSGTTGELLQVLDHDTLMALCGGMDVAPDVPCVDFGINFTEPDRTSAG